ncbi:TPA: hypothetical protein N0F65_006888 [Lagenidium giganteum]|uniref:BZIP domain-containing protein n=1 Tax=Lagenidium giganteum TaxID=4803 RepID=A0AAV2ZBR5_9STRA|nr:TPA: hypothetical protein N0F65_006888 [Lagenidium giganteum]
MQAGYDMRLDGRDVTLDDECAKVVRAATHNAPTRTRCRTRLCEDELDEKTRKRREQYRRHQHRHRAKQQQRLTTLQGDVQALNAEISTLIAQLQALKRQQLDAPAPSLTRDCEVKVAIGYFETFRHGYSKRVGHQQEEFLRSIMCESVVGSDWTGLEQFVEQWRLYGRFFASTEFRYQSVDVFHAGDITKVVATADLHLRPRREMLAELCPQMLGHEEVVQDVVSNVLVLPGTYTFFFDNQVVTKFIVDVDLFGALYQILGTMEKVTMVISGARIASSTGTIGRSGCSHHRVSDPRLHLHHERVSTRKHRLDNPMAHYATRYHPEVGMPTPMAAAIALDAVCAATAQRDLGAPVSRKRGAEKDDTVDEKVLRRRLQYKLHQRRHRAKQKLKIETLEHAERRALVERSLSCSRAAPDGLPARVAIEFLNVFRWGYSVRHSSDQAAFLQSVMRPEVEGPDYRGIPELFRQFYLYRLCFSAVNFEAVSFQVSGGHDLTIVDVRIMLRLRPRRRAMLALCPGLTSNEHLVQTLIGNELAVPGKFTFVFPEDGMVTSFVGDFDLLQGFYELLGNLNDVATALEGTRIHSTGQLRCTSHDIAQFEKETRMGMDYLLS